MGFAVFLNSFRLVRIRPQYGAWMNRIWRRQTSLIDGLTSEKLITENHAIMMYNPLLTE